ncbi:discoidin domain-containing protein [Umezawaea endophytica]|uniref:Discoidin domain-containing protein n=1 Tax=Umezawaea endophytica TaxID=1654476 RepID=A0A9X3AFF3_9PSEU|nr:discoidin domain-containing protein [Umezawaea endophytica]MCS7477120.1 discoidin domain-containing protein [Umezawaea endophytica]
MPEPVGGALVAAVDTAGPDAGPAAEEVLPQEARPAPRTVRRVPSTRAIRPGDLICGECGEGNVTTRKFCGRCGESLSSATTVRTQWWRRLAPRRGPRVVPAAKRPKPGAAVGRRPGRRIGTFVRRYTMVVVLVCGLVVGVYPPLRTFVLDKARGVGTAATAVLGTALSPVRPTSVAPTDTELEGHPAKAAFDQFKNTYWAARWDRTGGVQPAVAVDLGKVTALAKVIVTSGASDGFVAHNRPSILLFAYSNEKSDTVTLTDTPEPQEISLANGLAAKVVRVQVLQVFESEGAQDVALTEVEFFGVG